MLQALPCPAPPRAPCPGQAEQRPRAGVQRRMIPRLARRAARTAAAAAAAEGGPPGGGGGEGGAAGFLQNPAIAQREALRQFCTASSSEDQMAALQAASQLVDVGTRCGALLWGTATAELLPRMGQSLQMLCHTADLSLRGLLPGTEEQQATLVRAIYSTGLERSLPALQPLHLATALWALAAVGTPVEWTDELLQQVAERELAAGRLGSYNTKELASLLYAYGRLLRLRTSEVRSFGAELASELLKRWRSAPYVRSSFSSTDFADLAAACAALFGPRPLPAAAAGLSGGGGRSSSRQQPAVQCSASAEQPAAEPEAEALPGPASELLDELAGEVRRQLANKSTRSPWTPRDLVRLAAGYAAVRHTTPKSAQMLDSLSSFCVQRIRSRHLNCVSRPQDLTGLLEAYADLGHSSVAVPDLLAAVGDQVRRGVALQQERLDAAAAAAAAAPADPGTAAGSPAPAAVSPQQQPASPANAAAATQPSAQQHAAPPPVEGFSLAGINSLVASHLRLGYLPPPLLLHCLAPQVRRQLPDSSSADAAQLLVLLAAVPYNPGDTVVGLLLGRVADEAAPGGQAGSSAELEAARRAADQLLGAGSSCSGGLR